MEMSRTMEMLILVFGLIQLSYGIFDDCKLEGVNMGILSRFENTPIPDIHDGVVAEFPKDGITDVHLRDNTYLEASIVGDKILVSTTQRYSDVEYEVASTEYVPKLETEMEISCENGTSSFRFEQPITDENNKVPFFNKKVYQYRFGMDVNKDFELTELLPIYATDVDLTYEKLEVAIEPNEYLEIKPLYHWDPLRKTSNYALIAKKFLKKIDKTFNISVTDKTHTSTSLIHLVVE